MVYRKYCRWQEKVAQAWSCVAITKLSSLRASAQLVMSFGDGYTIFLASLRVTRSHLTSHVRQQQYDICIIRLLIIIQWAPASLSPSSFDTTELGIYKCRSFLARLCFGFSNEAYSYSSRKKCIRVLEIPHHGLLLRKSILDVWLKRFWHFASTVLWFVEAKFRRQLLLAAHWRCWSLIFSAGDGNFYWLHHLSGLLTWLPRLCFLNQHSGFSTLNAVIIAQDDGRAGVWLYSYSTRFAGDLLSSLASCFAYRFLGVFTFNQYSKFNLNTFRRLVDSSK